MSTFDFEEHFSAHGWVVFALGCTEFVNRPQKLFFPCLRLRDGEAHARQLCKLGQEQDGFLCVQATDTCIVVFGSAAFAQG